MVELQGLAGSFDFLITLLENLDFQGKPRGLVELQGLADSFDFFIDLLEILDFQGKCRVWLNSRVWLIHLTFLSIF